MKIIAKKSFLLVVALLSIGSVENMAYGGHGATNVLRQNLGELTELADIILVGKVIEMTDGISDHKLPYTEITFEISRSLKTNTTDLTTRPKWERPRKGIRQNRRTFTYRQFGLLKPRDMGDGKTLAVTLDGFPKYTMNEEVMVFLYKPASQSGLRTTVGLAQGKFSIKKGKMKNIINNRQLFSNMEVEREKLPMAEKHMLTQRSGPLDANMMINLVSRAVKEGLFKRFNKAKK